MYKYLKTADALPDALAATSGVTAGTSGVLWLADVSHILVSIAAIVSIVSGLYSIYKRSQNGESGSKD